MEINTKEKLVSILRRHLNHAIEKDKQLVKEGLKEIGETGQTYEEDRVKTGVYYNYAGLTRAILSQEFGDKWRVKKV